MFDFTTETILNSLANVSVLLPAADPGIPAGQKALEIKRLNTYLSGNVGLVWKTAGNNPVKEVATITLPSGQTAGTYRLELALEVSGSYPITLDRWAINKGKPIYVEFLVGSTQTTADNLATTALPLIQRGMKKNNGEAVLDVTFTKGTGTIIVTAQNEYLKIKNATVTKLDAAGENYNSIGATFVTTTPGKEGFGTAWSLLKNYRIPTQEATRFQGEDQDETPVAGILYNQYTFEYTAERNFTGSDAVGQKLTSKTTHVLFVPQSLASTFEGYVTSAFGPGSIADSATKASVNGSAIADIAFTQTSISAATAVAGTTAGSVNAVNADAPVSYSLVSGTGSTDNASFQISGSAIQAAGAVTAGTKSIRVQAVDVNGNTFVKVISVVVSA